MNKSQEQYSRGMVVPLLLRGRGTKRERERGRERLRGRRKGDSKRENRLVAGKGGASRVPSFRDMNLDFGLEGGRGGGGEVREGKGGGLGRRGRKWGKEGGLEGKSGSLEKWKGRGRWGRGRGEGAGDIRLECKVVVQVHGGIVKGEGGFGENFS